MPGRLFSKEACLVFIKATQGYSKKDSRKAASNNDSTAKDSKQKQKGIKGSWSYATNFMEWVKEAFIAEVRPKHNDMAVYC